MGKVIYEPEDNIRFAYFPHNMVMSVIAIMQNGTTVEIATVGREGIVGLVDLLGDGVSLARYVVQSSGMASRVLAEVLRRQVDINAEVRRLTFRYIQLHLAQAMQNGACNAVHSTEARCCRLILTMCDQIGRDELLLTHEFLAEMLAVQRPAVTMVMRHLQEGGIIRQGRGTIMIVDRAGLESMTCECYNLMRDQFEGLLSPPSHRGDRA